MIICPKSYSAEEKRNNPLMIPITDSRTHTAIQQLIRLYETQYPARVAAYYVEGTYADNTFVSTSDIDIAIVFRGRLTEDERIQAEQAWQTSDQSKTCEMDITICDEESLRGGVHPNLKLGSCFVYGEDICANYPIMPIESWARERMHAAYYLMIKVHQRPVPVRLPLDFPDPADEFYGYTKRTIRMPDESEVPCTRNLVRTTGWAATALLAHQAGQYVTRKRDCHLLYRQYIGDEWSSLLEQIYTFCRAWHYLIPTDPTARQQLRTLCQQTLSFERHFLELYQPFLAEQLNSSDTDQAQFAAYIEKEIPRYEPPDPS